MVHSKAYSFWWCFDKYSTSLTLDDTTKLNVSHFNWLENVQINKCAEQTDWEKLNRSAQIKFIYKRGMGGEEKSQSFIHTCDINTHTRTKSLIAQVYKELKKWERKYFFYIARSHMVLTAFSYAWFNYSMACDNFTDGEIHSESISVEMTKIITSKFNYTTGDNFNGIITRNQSQCLSLCVYICGRFIIISFSSLSRKSYERDTLVHKTLISHFSI